MEKDLLWRSPLIGRADQGIMQKDLRRRSPLIGRADQDMMQKDLQRRSFSWNKRQPIPGLCKLFFFFLLYLIDQ